MKVFIGWSGNSSKCVAQRLRGWLPYVLPYVKPWMSEGDIPKGTLWNTELWRNLRKADFGILCLAPENITEPWVIFEAGALSCKHERERVSPFLLGIEPEDLPTPLSQFQCTCFDKKNVKSLIERINECAFKNKRLSEKVLNESFSKYWRRLYRKLKAIDLTQFEEEKKEDSGEDSQSEKKEEQLKKIHIDILRIIASSPLPSCNLIYLQVQLQMNQRLIIIKLNDLIGWGYVKRVGSYGYPEIIIEDKGVLFLESKGLLD